MVVVMWFVLVDGVRKTRMIQYIYDCDSILISYT
jgi:hypothetical protein